MKLSKRIYALADTVIDGHTVADIGTDHGYVPMLLIRDGKCPRAIMSDISGGSLAKAKETFRQCDLLDKVGDDDFRIGDGLQTIGAGEVDEIIIGGLGGHTITEILSSDEAKTISFKRFILQPRKHSGALRYYLYTHGWDIESEHLAEEGKFACEIITASPTGVTFREAPYLAEDIRWKYPESLLETDRSLAANRISWKISSIREQIDNMRSSGKADKDTLDMLEDDLAYLTSMLLVAEGRI